MKPIVITLVALLFTSCIPVRIAPKIESHKIAIGKKFRKSLPKEHLFIFEDSKDADEFYYYINAKYNRNNLDVEFNSPFTIDGVTYYLSFYEAEIPDKTINLVPLAIDVATHNSNFQTDLSDSYTTRKGNWYIAISVTDKDFKNCLKPSFPKRKEIIDYLDATRAEYFNTNDYQFLVKSKKP